MSFVRLFEEYGFTVEPFGIDSYIADNGVFCVPFSVHTVNTNYGGYSDISAVSFLSCDKDAIKNHYRDEKHIGYAVFSDYMNDRLKFTHIGNICNHDHATFEVESWLQKVGTKTIQNTVI